MGSSLQLRSLAFALLGVLSTSLRAPAAPAAHGRASSGERPSWVEQALPSNFTGAGSVKALGTNVYFQTPTHVHLWSAITTHWTAVPVSATAQVTQFNAFVTIEDGATIHAFATRTGVVDTLHLPATPQVFHGPVSSCWISIAVLGTDAWSFGAFDGTWHHQVLLGASPNVLISQTAGVLSDGVNVYGVSAYFGDLVPSPAPASATLSAGGDCVTAWTPASVAGFSAHTNEWAVEALSSSTTLANERGYSMYADGSDLLAYSACTGTFARYPIAPGFTFIAGRYVGAARVGDDVIAYSSGQNSFAARTFSSPPVVTVDDEVLAVTDLSGVTAFSVATGSFSNLAAGTFFSVQTNDAVVWIDDGVQGRAYCAVTGDWIPAPVTTASAQASVMRNVVVLATAQGYHAFSGRTGAWISRGTSHPFSFSAPNSSDLFVAFDGIQTLVFDPVIVRWASIRTAAPVQNQDVWRQTFVGFDGNVALGFGLMNNAWSSIATRGTFQALDANSSCGFVLTSSHVYAYSAHGSLSTLSRFPEFSRLQPIAAPLRLIQTAQPGSRVVALLAHAAAYEPRLPFGTLFIDPATVFLRVRLGTVPARGVLDVPLDLSGIPGLAGTSVHIQTIVTPPHGPQWAANSIAPIVL